MQSSARGQLAVRDADLSYPASISAFSCAVGVPISEANFPNLTMLLRRSMGDAALAASEVAINGGLARHTMATNGFSVRKALKRSFNEPMFG